MPRQSPLSGAACVSGSCVQTDQPGQRRAGMFAIDSQINIHTRRFIPFLFCSDKEGYAEGLLTA